MRLRFIDVLRTAHREQRGPRQAILDQRHRIGDRERIAIQEHQQILIRRLMSDLHRQMIQLPRMTPTLLEHPIEMNPMRRIDPLQRRPRHERHRQMLTQIPRLNLNPPRRPEMDRHHMQHHSTRSWMRVAGWRELGCTARNLERMMLLISISGRRAAGSELRRRRSPASSNGRMRLLAWSAMESRDSIRMSS